MKYDEFSSSDARRGHLRLPKFPNFSKGESFPLWPPLSLRRRRWSSLLGDPRPSTRHFFHNLQRCPSGTVVLQVFRKIALVQAIQIFFTSCWKLLTLAPACQIHIFLPTRVHTPCLAHGGTYLNQYLKHERGIVERNLTYPFSFIFRRETRFSYLESAYGCLNTSKLRSNLLHFQTLIKNS